MNTEKVEEIYSRSAPIYDIVFGYVFEQGRKRAVKLLDLKPYDEVLELGIGTGLLMKHYPPYVHLTGIDLCDKMLEKAKKRLQKYGIRKINVECMDATKMNFPDNTFDKAIGAYFLSAAPDPIAVAREISRVVKPGGTIVFLNHFRSDNPIISSFETLISPLGKKMGFWTTLQLGDVIAGTPFDLASIEGTNLFNYWKIVKCVNNKQVFQNPPETGK